MTSFARRLLAASLASTGLALAASAAAANRTAVVPFARGTIVLPVPDGFGEPSSTPPVVLEAMQHAAPAGIRVMAMLMDEKFLPAAGAGERPHLSRYFLVEADRRSEMWGMSAAEFDAVKTGFRNQSAEERRAVEAGVEAAGARVAEKLGNTIGDHSLRVRTGREMITVFDEGPDSISLVSTTSVSQTGQDGTHEFLQVAATAFLRVQGKPLSVAVYSHYTSPDDLLWAKQAVQAWLARIAALNAPDGAR